MACTVYTTMAPPSSTTTSRAVSEHGLYSVTVETSSESEPDLIALFEAEMRQHFTRRLCDKWDCDVPGHTMCVLTVDGGHHQLCEESINVWVCALCRGEATTAQPPDGVLNNCHSRPSTPRAVSIAPSRHRNAKSSVLAASTSFLQSLESRSYSSSASGAYGPGYLGGKALEWLGKKVLDCATGIIIGQRFWRYGYRLHQCSKDPVLKSGTVFRILENAVDMSRPSYPHIIHSYSGALSYKAHKITTNPQIIAVGTIIYAISSEMSDSTQFEDLAYEIIALLKKSPLSLQGPEELASIFNAILREVVYSQETVSHYGLFISALLILDGIRTLSPGATFELDYVYQLRTRRSCFQKNDPESCRPWEVELFVILEPQDPSFKAFVLGPYGVPGLLSALELLLYQETLSDSQWYTVEKIFWTLDAVLQVDWVVDAVASKHVRIFVDTLRRALLNRQRVIRPIISSLKHVGISYPAMLDDIIANDIDVVLREFLALARRQKFPESYCTREAVDLAVALLELTEGGTLAVTSI